MKGPALALVAVTLLVAGCGTVDRRPLASLRAMEEAELAYPGSTRLSSFGVDQVTGLITGPRTAYFGYYYGSDASDADIEAFYEAELTRRSWRAKVAILGGSDLRAREWENGDRVFRLSFRRRDEFGGLDAGTLARYPTVYEIALFLLIPEPTISPSPTGS